MTNRAVLLPLCARYLRNEPRLELHHDPAETNSRGVQDKTFSDHISTGPGPDGWRHGLRPDFYRTNRPLWLTVFSAGLSVPDLAPEPAIPL